jgi:hypothetical protein
MCLCLIKHLTMKKYEGWGLAPPFLTVTLGRAIAEAVSRWLPTAAARVLVRVW